MRLLIVFILLNFQSIAKQDSLDLIIRQAIQNAKKPPNSTPTYYFPFYNDVQLIELDYYTHTMRDDVLRSIKPHGGLWYSRHVNGERSNGYILRNSKGEVLEAYGVRNPYGTYLLPPDEAPIVTHKAHLNSEKNLFKGQSFSWKDGNGYGYRFAVMTIREQRTEMPEMAYEIYGMLDTLGNVVIPPTHRSIHYYQGEYLAMGDNGASAIYDSTFTNTFEYTGDAIQRIGYNVYANFGDKPGIMNRDGKYIEKYPYSGIQESYYSSDLIYSILDGNRHLYGLMANDLTKLTKPIYHRIFPLTYGHAVFDTKGKVAILNRSGKQITGFDLENSPLSYYEDGYYILSKSIGDSANSIKFGMIDTLGNNIIPFVYDEIKPFYNDLALVRLNEKYGIVDRKGKLQGEVKYDQITKLNEEKIQVQVDSRIGFINRKGEMLQGLKHPGFSSMDPKFVHYSGYGESRWIVNTVTGDTFSIMHNEHFGPEGFARVGKVVEKVVGKVVKKVSMRGMIDKTGNFVLPIEYNRIFKFKNGVLLVQKDGKYGLLDENLKIVEPLIHRYYKTLDSGEYKFYDVNPYK